MFDKDLKPLFTMSLQRFADGDEGGEPMGGVNPPAEGGEGVPTPAPAQPAGGQPAQPDKTFTQADIDRIISDRVGRESKKYSELENKYKSMEQMTKQYEAYYQYLQQVLGGEEGQQNGGTQPNPYEERISSLENMLYSQKVDAMEKALVGKFPELGQNQELLDEVYKVAAQYKIDDLEKAYWMVTAPNMKADYDVKLTKAKEDAIKEYLEKKTNQPLTPEGSGGSVPTGAKSPKTFDEATKAAKEFFKNSKNI